MIKTIHSECSHTVWSHDISPALTVNEGESVEVNMKDASNGQITPKSNKTAVENLNQDKINPVTGPIFVEGAEPGDALRVTIEELRCSGWGWTAIIPGFGLLKDEFPDADLNIWKYNRDTLEPALFGEFAKVPLKPFIGTLGVAPARDGELDIIPPRHIGGNMDIHDICAGSELILPVECEGALFSAGDTHAAQGHGEVCGTAIESPLDAVLKFEVLKNQAPEFPRIKTTTADRRNLDKNGFEITTGIGPNLYKGAGNALRSMIDLLTAQHKLTPVQAYMLCSVCADLRITEIVNEPNFVVACYFPRTVLA